MSSDTIVDPVIQAETGAPARATYILHPRRSFGARLGRFFSRIFVLSFVAVAGFGSGYAFKEREGLLARQELQATISTLEKQVVRAETMRETRDAQSMTIEIDLTTVLSDFRMELTKVAQDRVAAASGRLATSLVQDAELNEKRVPLGKPLGFDLRGLPTTHGSVPPRPEYGRSAPPAVGRLGAEPDEPVTVAPAGTATLSIEDDVAIPQQAENSLLIR